MIRKISGKTKSPSYTHLNHPVTETKSTSKFYIAETLGETFLNNSSKWERSGSVVECLTRDRRVAGSSLTGVTALWSLSKTHLS